MMKYVRVILVLVLVSVFSAGILSLADMVSRKKIRENQARAIREAIITIEPRTENITGEEGYWQIFDRTGRLLGYMFLAEGQGYQGKIKILCGLDSNVDKLLGIEIIESSETPGLGAKINQPWFKEQFKGLGSSQDIEYTKTRPIRGNQIQAITGATISSKSVVNILNKEIVRMKKRTQDKFNR